MDTVAVLFNPSSGRGKSQKRKGQIEARLQHFGIPTEWFVSQSEEHLKQLARQLSQRFPVLVAVGGDTTFTMTASEIIKLGRDTTLGTVGAGSANDISRGLGIYDLDAFCAALQEVRTRRMDAGCLHLPDQTDPIYFMGALSLGLGVEVNRYVARARSRFPLLNRGGSTVQCFTAAAGVRHCHTRDKVPLRVSLESDSNSRVLEFSLMVFANSPYYANGIKILPDTTPFDGRLFCFRILTGSLSRIIALLPSLVKGNHLKKDDVEAISGKSFQVNPLGQSISLQYDGEVLSRIPNFSIAVQPAALKVITTLAPSGDTEPA